MNTQFWASLSPSRRYMSTTCISMVRHRDPPTNLRRLVKRILRKYGYPPDKQEQATRTVLEQAEVVSAGWAGQGRSSDQTWIDSAHASINSQSVKLISHLPKICLRNTSMTDCVYCHRPKNLGMGTIPL